MSIPPWQGRTVPPSMVTWTLQWLLVISSPKSTASMLLWLCTSTTAVHKCQVVLATELVDQVVLGMQKNVFLDEECELCILQILGETLYISALRVYSNTATSIITLIGITSLSWYKVDSSSVYDHWLDNNFVMIRDKFFCFLSWAQSGNTKKLLA